MDSNENGRAQLVWLRTELKMNKPSNPDMVNHPPHYNAGGVECIEAIKAACTGLNGFEGYCTGNSIKYLWRWKHKNKVQDLEKAIWYINKLAKEIKNDEV